MHETRTQGKTGPEGMRDTIVEIRPDDLNRLIRPERKLPMSGHPAFRPHPRYLAWHREHQFKR